MATAAKTPAAKKTSNRITSISIRENAKKDYSPRWDGAEAWDGETFTRRYHDAMKYYNLNFSGKDLKSKVIDWMGRNGYDKKTIAAFKKTRDGRCSVTVGSIAACLIRGMPEVHSGFNNGRNTVDWLKRQITEIIAAGAKDVDPEEIAAAKAAAEAAKPQAPVLSIQDRVKEQAGQMGEEIDAAIDSFITDPDSFNPKEFKMVSLLRGKGAKPAHTRFIKAFYKKDYDELMELASGKSDEQLREAYKHHPRKNVRKLIEFYESIMTACDQIAAEAKVLKKPRTKKVKPAEEMVKSLKFRVSDDKLAITSVPPVQLIGAQAAIVYNTTTRKLGYYIAKSTAGFGVKGTTLLDYTEKSTQKTLRKPAEQIKEFKEQNTQRKFENWYNKSVTTVETALTGRFNEDTVILKVFK
jgi:hypothetical protein